MANERLEWMSDLIARAKSDVKTEAERILRAELDGTEMLLGLVEMLTGKSEKEVRDWFEDVTKEFSAAGAELIERFLVELEARERTRIASEGASDAQL